MAEVGCAGILVADTFCGPMRALPGEGQLVATGPFRRCVGGCAANVAIGLAKQGVGVEVIGCIGRDPAAKTVVAGLTEQGVGCDRIVQVGDQSTSETVILIVEGEDRRYVHVFGANAAFTAAHVEPDWAAALKVFYLGGLFAMSGIDPEALAGLLEHCRRHGVMTVVDVVLPSEFCDRDALRRVLRHVDYFLPNDDEARVITGEEDILEQVRGLQAFGAQAVIITRGPAGLLAARGDDVWHAPAYGVQALDPSGSGDAFSSGVVTGLVHGWDMARTLSYASALGASVTQAIGATQGVFESDAACRFIQSNPLPVTLRHMDDLRGSKGCL
ncbi:MAG: carbohydrate kinase family protein [Pirellulaceae bacterium]